MLTFKITDGEGFHVNINQRPSDGYIDITSICKCYGKSLSDFRRLPSSISYIRCLANCLNVDASQLIVLKMDGRVRHAWAEPRIAVQVIAWCTGDTIKIAQDTMWLCNYVKGVTCTEITHIRPKVSKIRKQHIFEQAIRFAYPCVDLIIDRCVDGTCKFRPDMLIKTPWGHVIVEVDEHQHAGYHGELDRMQCIRNALATRTAFLRINPDRYEDDNGVIWESVLVKDEVDNEEVMRRWKILHPIVGRMLCDWAPDTYVFYNTQGRDAMCDTPSDGAVDNNLIVSSSKDVVLSAPTGNVVATTDKFVLLSGSHAARMLISDSNELVFELKDDTSGSFLPVARFATTI